MNPRKAQIYWLMLILAISALVCIALFDVAPPETVTRGRMRVIEMRINAFVRQQHRIPDDLSQLPVIEGYSQSIRDAWGNPIIYSHDSEGIVTLRSLGGGRAKQKEAALEYVFDTGIKSKK